MDTNETSMRGNLEFVETFTIEEFKSLHDNHDIDIQLNANTGLLSFAYGRKNSDRGAVSKAFDIENVRNPVISQVVGDDGIPFFLLHEQGEGAMETVLTF